MAETSPKFVAGMRFSYRRKNDVIGCFFLFFVTFGILSLTKAIGYGWVNIYDGEILYRVTESIIERGSVVIRDPDPAGRNSPYAKYGIGQSILLIPFYLAGKIVGSPGEGASFCNIFGDSIVR